MKPAQGWKAAVLCMSVWLGCSDAPGMSRQEQDITPADMRARIAFLASDMLGGRPTPGRGLDLAANYIRSEFGRIGLEMPPSGEFIQRYQLARTAIGDDWRLALEREGRRATLRHRRDFWGIPWAAGTVEGTVRFMTDRPQPVPEVTEPEIWVVDLSAGVLPREWLTTASGAGVVGLVFVLPDRLVPQLQTWLDQDQPGQALYELGDVTPSLPAILVSEEALNGALDRLGYEVRPAAAPVGSRKTGLSARLSADLRVETATAPNVIGILPGRDPDLREEYVLISAHMDHLGIGPAVDGDSIYNGADDNASGTAGLLEIAEAAAALDRRPRRSLAFLAVSGEEKGLLGSTWFVNHPPIPLERIVANINIDMIGRNWEDSIAVIGKPYSTLGAFVDSVAAAHSELGITTVGDLWPAERFFLRSDHFNFARKGIPAVFFFNGVHEDYHRPSDEPGKIKEHKAARIARLIFHVAVGLGDAQQRPRWDDRARRAIVEGG